MFNKETSVITSLYISTPGVLTSGHIRHKGRHFPTLERKFSGVRTPVANADLVAGRSSCNAYLAVKWKLQSSGRASTVAGIGIIGKADLDRHLIGISSVWEGLTHEQMD